MKRNDNKVLCLADDVVTALYFLVFLFAHWKHGSARNARLSGPVKRIHYRFTACVTIRPIVSFCVVHFLGFWSLRFHSWSSDPFYSFDIFQCAWFVGIAVMATPSSVPSKVLYIINPECRHTLCGRECLPSRKKVPSPDFVAYWKPVSYLTRDGKPYCRVLW